MITVIAGGRPRTIPTLAALGAAASLVLAGCSIAGQEQDAGAGGRPPAATSNSPDAGGSGGTAPAEAADGAGTAVPSPEESGDGAAPGANATPDEDVPAADSAEPDGAAAPDDGDGLDEPPPFYANTLPDDGDALGGQAGILTGLRTGVHPGFDRVVFELGGRGVPQWHVRYVDFVVGDPSGETLEIPGAGVLEVTLVGVDYPDGESAAYAGPSRVAVGGSAAVTEVLLSSVFEGQLQAFIGVDPRELPFRAYRMTEPSRVVVEVQHPR